MSGRYESHSGEEGALWTASLADFKALKEVHARGEAASKHIARLQKSLYNLDDDRKIIDTVEKLEASSRDFASSLDSECTLLIAVQENLGLLIALRQATESGLGGAEDSRRKKRKLPDSDLATDNTRAKKPRSPLDLLIVGAPVAFKQPKTKNSDGEWIQCNIVRITSGDGMKARCEVQDPEPDENGAPGQTYKTTLGQLIPISRDNFGLTPFAKGASVLARYPETTTFYKAEVVSTRRDFCYLRFEGEEEFGKETEVERRLVLDIPKGL